MNKHCIEGKKSFNNLLHVLKIMRVTLFFLFFCILFSSAANSFSQEFTFNQKSASIREICKQIERESDYVFVFSDNSEKMIDKKVNIDANAKNVAEILDEVLSNTGLTYEILDKQIVIYESGKIISAKVPEHKIPETIIQQPPKNQVTGRIVDAQGEAIIGANIVEVGTTNGTVTDVDGNFTLSVEPDATIRISYIGYLEQNINTAGRTNFNITLLEDTQALEELVVIGYGVQQKVNLTGAVSMISVDEQMSSRAVSNVSSSLAGLVPGLAAVQNSGMAGNNRASLLIRGLGTVNNANPLVVVDGMPDVDINRIDINDVATISVLKDAASSAIYGSRAANGVILITTKSGKGKKPTINFTSTIALETPKKSIDFMADYPRALTLHQRAYGVNHAPASQLYKNGTIDQWLALGMVDPVKYPNTDWWDIIMKNGSMQKHNLSVSGSSDLSNFYVSVGIQNQQGLQINNEFKIYNFRTNYDYKASRNMNVGVKLNANTSNYVYAYSEGFGGDGGPSGGDMINAIAGILPFDPESGYYGGVMAYGEDPTAYNPLVYYDNTLKRQNRQEANGSMYLDWTPLQGLTGRIEYAVNYYNQFHKEAYTPQSAYNTQTQSFNGRVYVGTNTPIVNNTNTGYKTLLTGSVNYNTTIAQRHNINALFVYSEEYWNDRVLNASRMDRIHPSLSEIDAALTTTQTTRGNSSTEGLRSYIGRLNYEAFDKYLLSATFRYDGSSKFLPGSQYGFFPSISAGWRFVEEDFIKSFVGGFLSNGKLRVSYGSLGNNSGVGRYEQRQTLASNNYITDANGVNIDKGFIYRRMVNQDLTWENTTVFNIGLDLGFLNNRLTAELDFYNRLTTGMNRPSDLPILIELAYDAPRTNIGNLRNRGIEGNFNWRDKIGQVVYGLVLNVSYNATRLEKWNEYLGKGTTFLNMPYHFVWSFEDMGIAQTWQDVYNATPQGASPGDILRKDLNGDGRIDDNDRKAYPNIQQDRPTTNFSLNCDFGWKGFDLAVLLQGSTGRKDYWLNRYNNIDPPTLRYAFTEQHWENPWSLDNRDGAWPRLNGNQNRTQTTFWLDDMSFLRVKNLQLGYTVPKGFLQKVGVNSFRIFGSAENLATFTSYRGLDPEKSGTSDNLYPIVRSYSLGINLSF